MKIFPNLVKAVADGIYSTEIEGRYADKVIEYLLKSNPKWGSRDRGFIAETIYEIIRYKRFYLLYVGKIQVETKQDCLHLACIFLELKHNQKQLIDGQTFDLKEVNVSALSLKEKESFPDWLVELAESELGAKTWEAEMHAQNIPAELVLRVNSLKINKLQLKSKLDFETEISEIAPDALIVKKRTQLFKNEYFQNGFFEVQDGSSQLIAPFLAPKPGDRVVDACAGAGGKSLHLAAIMQNKGRILSMDVEDFKLKELQKRAKRSGVSIIETRVIESSKTIKRLAESADKVLLDVPCSGTGVFRRNPDAKWKLNQDFIDRITKTQQEILQSYAKMTKIGGELVYATCSILPRENNQQVEKFLSQNLNFEFVDEQKVFAHQQGFDGFYMAKLKRKS